MNLTPLLSPHLAVALHFIYDYANEPLRGNHIVQATSISRRQLEIRFRRILGCTPHDHLSRQRIERVKKLLAAPGKTKFHKLAMTCGFSNVERMRLVFKRVTGMTLMEYRRTEAQLGAHSENEATSETDTFGPSIEERL